MEYNNQTHTKSLKIKNLTTSYCTTPIGTIAIESCNNLITRVSFADLENYCQSQKNAVILQLDEYFSGIRKDFNLPINLQGTDFQKKVWQELLKIPYGTTLTYAQIAKKIGNPKAARAVGMACRNNPLLIIVPCHRVIGANGSLTGYYGGLQKKQWLVNHEKCI